MKDKAGRLIREFRQYWHTPPRGRYMTFKEIASLSVGGIGVRFIVYCISQMILSVGNTLIGKYRSGLVVKSPTGKVTIASNTITSGNAKGVKSMGISVSGCKKGVTITGNKITGNNTGGGIYVKSSKASISKNTVKKSTKKIIK